MWRRRRSRPRSRSSQISEATVYGVAVPGTEGAAGMAAIVADRTLDFAQLRRHLTKRLPGYARPLFLRLTANIAATSTFKHNKNQIAREGFNVSVVRDEIYFDDPEEQAYVLLDAALHERIGAGKIRL